MRILICMTHYSPWSNSIAASLQSIGHEIHVFDFAYGSQSYIDIKNAEIASDVKNYKKHITALHLISPLTRGNFRYALAALKLNSVARNIKADIILTLYGGGFGLMTYLSKIRPYAIYTVGSDVLLAGALLKRINRLVFNAASQVFANGEYLAAKTQEQAPNARILPLLIGVDLDLLKMSDFRAKPVQVICTRGFESVYNNDAIIRAISKFPEDSPDFQMVFVSGGPKLSECIALADKLLTNWQRKRIVFWGGVSYDKLLSGLCSSHIFISMSRSDGTATSVLEAMASGLFPILSDIPQNRALIKHGDPNGILVSLDDDMALAKVLLYAIRNVNICIRYSLDNRSVIEHKANASQNRKILAQTLEEIVKKVRLNKKS